MASPAKFMAQTRADGSIEVISLDGSPAPAGRSYQLWALPQGVARAANRRPANAALGAGAVARVRRAGRRLTDGGTNGCGALRRAAGSAQPGSNTRSVT
jgi:hypothetical protein